MMDLSRLALSSFSAFTTITIVSAFTPTSEVTQDITAENINLSRVKLKAENIKWTNIANTSGSQQWPRKVDIVPEGSAAGGTSSTKPFGQVRTSKNSEIGAHVNLHRGAFKGLNRKMKLKLEDDVANIFGTCLEIDPSKESSEINISAMKLDVSVEQAIGPAGATALVTANEEKYEKNFKCTVCLSGSVIYREPSSALDVKIAEVFKHVPRYQPDLAALSVVGDKVQFEMEGEIVFFIDHGQKIELKTSTK